uniref:Auxin response factor 3 n=2 Tax=Lygus hesperus TaxID=30085 RepID=A0A0A9WHS6_LYGHE
MLTYIQNISAYGSKDYMMEISKDEFRDKPVIEMNLSLGILEPKLNSDTIIIPTKHDDNELEFIPKLYTTKSTISKDAITVIDTESLHNIESVNNVDDTNTKTCIDNQDTTDTVVEKLTITPNHVLTREEIGFEPILEGQDGSTDFRPYQCKQVNECIDKKFCKRF